MSVESAGKRRRAARPGVQSSGFFALRTPLLPFAELLSWSEGLTAMVGGQESPPREQDIAADRAVLRDRLRRAFARAELREALFVASPSLEGSFAEWEKDPQSERGQKVEQALVRYFARMITRCTPFGMFAGNSVGAIGPTTQLEIAALSQYRRHARLDTHYLTALTQTLARSPTLRQHFVCRPNSSLYRAGATLRYAEAQDTGGARSYRLVGIEPSDYLEAVLQRAALGARLPELVELLTARDPEVTREEAEEFVGELLDTQVLVAELDPTITGPEPVYPLIEQLKQIPEAAAEGEGLKQAALKLEELNAHAPGVPTEQYRAVAAVLEALPVKVEASKLFQVDMDKPSPRARLGEKALEAISRAVDLLQRLGAGVGEAPNGFLDAFVKKYEQREVPLVEVLDDDLGIGMDSGEGEASPLLRGLAIGGGQEPEPPKWTARDAFLLEKIESLEAGQLELELSNEDIERLSKGTPKPLPDAIGAFVELEAESPAAIDEGRFRVRVRGINGPSGALMLGRFCHADPVLEDHVRRHLRAEEAFQPDAIYAEIVHLPEGRLGNILLRPVLRDYEIVYLGRSGAPWERQLPITDLLVSARGGRLVLRSARLGKEVLPRLTSAHNFAHGLAPYRLLCRLQRQGTSPAYWSWGVHDSRPFLPRLVHGQVVLAVAQWNLRAPELKSLVADGQLPGQLKAFHTLAGTLRLPRFFGVVDGDNILVVDCHNVLMIESFIQLVARRGAAKLMELFPAPDKLCLTGPEGGFMHELLVPMTRVVGEVVEPKPAVPKSAAGEEKPVSVVGGQRAFVPGSEWLFLKLYAGTNTLDHLLRDLVAPQVRAALASSAASSWFFIRYGDPDWHLRLRLTGEAGRLWKEVAPALFEAARLFIADGRVWKIQVDTYDRELERYGGAEGTRVCEQLFAADSEAVLAVVEAYPGDEGQDARWRLALRGMDMLLEDLQLDLTQRIAVAGRVRESFGREFNAGRATEDSLAKRYRAERKQLETLFAPQMSPEEPLARGMEILRARSEMLKPVAAELRALEQRGNLGMPLARVAESLLHMHANRMFRGAARKQELVLYDFLLRTYESRLARNRKGAMPG